MKYATPEEVDGIGILFNSDDLGIDASPDPTGEDEAKTLSSFVSALLKDTGGAKELRKIMSKACLRALPVMLKSPIRHEKAMFGVYVERFLRELTGWDRGKAVRERNGKKKKITMNFSLPSGFVFDLRCTMGRDWAIPADSVGEICLLVKLTPAGKRRFLSVGAFVALSDNLRHGGAVGGRAGIHKDAKKKIRWLIGGKKTGGVMLPSIYEGRDLVDLSAAIIDMQVDGDMSHAQAMLISQWATRHADALQDAPSSKEKAEEDPCINWSA